MSSRFDEIFQDPPTDRCLDCGTTDKTGQHGLYNTNTGCVWVCPNCLAVRNQEDQKRVQAAQRSVDEWTWRDRWEQA